MNEQDLLRKLHAIEALFAGATTDGERDAAGRARARLRERLREAESVEAPVEFTLTMHDPWSRKLLLALLRSYGLKPYRYRRQRRQTVMVKVPKQFMNSTIWPQFERLDAELRSWLGEATDRIIAQALGQKSEDVQVIPQGQLPM